jgi:hypothetical protein
MLDNLIKTQLTQLANSTPVVLTCDGSPESRLANRLHNITRMRLMRFVSHHQYQLRYWLILFSANIKTHRYRALMEYPAILEKFKAFPPLDISERPPSECNTSQSTGVGKVHQIFPFSSLDSLQNCCDSALGISACLDSLKGDLLGDKGIPSSLMGPSSQFPSGSVHMFSDHSWLHCHDDIIFPQLSKMSTVGSTCGQWSPQAV